MVDAGGLLGGRLDGYVARAPGQARTKLTGNPDGVNRDCRVRTTELARSPARGVAPVRFRTQVGSMSTQPAPLRLAADALPESPARAPVLQPLDDGDRLRALQETALLDSPPEEAFDRFTRMAARLLRAPVALVSLVDAERQFFKSCVGLPDVFAESRETPLSHSFCRHAVERATPLVIGDAREHPLVRDSDAIRDLGVVAYLGIPLATADGTVLGSFCVLDGQPRQ